VITSLADALDTTLADLLGMPNLIDWAPDVQPRTVTRLREALMDYPALTGLSDAEPTPASTLRSDVADVWDAYQASRFGYATTRLPQVIAGGRGAVRAAATGQDRREAQRMLALAYHAAAATLGKVGEPDLAWIAADRGLAAAEESDDVAVQLSLLRSAAHCMLSNGRHAPAADVVARATDRFADVPMDDEPVRWSLLGSLYLVGAVAASRAEEPGEARTFLARAREAGQQLGRDANLAWTAFGPTNVAVHDLTIAVELGDIQTALAVADRVDARGLPVERRVRHALEVARVYAFANRDADAFDTMLHAEHEAPEQVRYHYIARELVLGWMRRNRRHRPELDRLAQRLRLA